METQDNGRSGDIPAALIRLESQVSKSTDVPRYAPSAASHDVAVLEQENERLRERNKRLAAALKLAQRQRDLIATNFSEAQTVYERTALKSGRRRTELRRINRVLRFTQMELVLQRQRAQMAAERADRAWARAREMIGE